MLGGGLFWGHVTRRADNGAGRSESAGRLTRGRPDVLGQAKVGDDRLPFLVDQHVGRFQIAVQNPLLVGSLHASGEQADKASCFALVHRAFVCQVGQRGALDILH